jgi:hypothetical protein
MAGNPTHADADLILKLYEARREPEIRKARAWWTTQFWPNSVDDVMAVMRGMGTQENAWYRQVLGYWGMAVSFLHNGVLNEKLFYDPSFCGEMLFIYAKLEPFIGEIRDKTQNPLFLTAIETAAKADVVKPRLDLARKNIEGLRKARADAKA